MKLEQIKEQILPLLREKPRTVFELAAETDYSIPSLSNWLKILEADGSAQKIKRQKERKIIWAICNDAPTESGGTTRENTSQDEQVITPESAAVPNPTQVEDGEITE